jgi:type I restriction enzyme S subunit
MSEWKETTLGQLVTFQRGHDLSQTQFEEGKYPIIGSNGIIGYHNKFTTRKNGITIGRSGNIGSPFYIEEDFWAHNTTLYVKEFHNSYPKFVYYLLKTFNFQNFNSGSAVPSLNRNYIHPYPVYVPDYDEQVKIAAVLSCLDRKISNLRQQNETLERIAQTLFKHWFVDFEFPNEDGKPYRSSGGEMVRSELGEIPAGWRVGTMADIIEVRDGTHESPKQTEKGFHLITSKHLKKEGIDFESAYLISEFDYVEANKRSKVDTLDILLSMIGTVGLLYFVMEREINFAIKNIGLFKSSKNQDYSEFIFLFLTSVYGSSYLRMRLSGTTQSYVTLASLREMPLIIPDEIRLLEFRRIIKSIFSKSYANRQQVQTLTKTRDRLLPKLMSGKLRITES